MEIFFQLIQFWNYSLNVNIFRQQFWRIGGETRCIYQDSTPFAFQIIPGDSDKLLFYFQGGGACWDKASTLAGLCTSDSVPQNPVGVFDRDNVNNNFASYTIVHVLYCSGNVHAGNVTRDYTDNTGNAVIQKGSTNTQAALDWTVKPQQVLKLYQRVSPKLKRYC